MRPGSPSPASSRTPRASSSPPPAGSLAGCSTRRAGRRTPAAAVAEASRIIEATLVDPPRSNLATWYALLAEMQLAAGLVDDAVSSLDRAEAFMASYGERYAEGLVLLVRARALAAAGAPAADVVSATRRAVDLAREREAHLFAERAQASGIGIP